jgi:hypothetical protein
VGQVRARTAGRGIRAIDRGGDRKGLLEPLQERGERFVVRSVWKRSVINRQQSFRSASLVSPFRFYALADGIKRILCGAVPVRPLKPSIATT